MRQVQHIRMEKKILESINHPFIVEVNGTFQTPSHIYMIFDFLCGGELFSLLREESVFCNDVTLFYTVEVILALHYLH